MDHVKETVNFIHASALNHCELVALFEEVENEYDKIFYRINVR
jgi:hypothetical protein